MRAFEEVSDLLDPGLGKAGSVLAFSGAEAYQSSMLQHGSTYSLKTTQGTQNCPVT